MEPVNVFLTIGSEYRIGATVLYGKDKASAIMIGIGIDTLLDDLVSCDTKEYGDMIFDGSERTTAYQITSNDVARYWNQIKKVTVRNTESSVWVLDLHQDDFFEILKIVDKIKKTIFEKNGLKMKDLLPFFTHLKQIQSSIADETKQNKKFELLKALVGPNQMRHNKRSSVLAMGETSQSTDTKVTSPNDNRKDKKGLEKRIMKLENENSDLKTTTNRLSVQLEAQQKIIDELRKKLEDLSSV